MLRSHALSPLALIACLLGSTPALAQSPDVMARVLEAMAARGEIRHAELEHLLTLTNGSPSPSQAADPLRCWTVPLVQARAFAHRNGAHVKPLPPPASVGFVESETLPLRVYYQNTGQLSFAETMLAAAEDSWAHQIDELGAYAPFTDDNEDGEPKPGLYLYVAATGMGGGGYTEWLSDVPETSRSDCSCRVVVDPGNYLEEVAEVVYHEFVHATQMATDCTESISAWENFAVAAEHLRFPESYYFVWGFLPEFQLHPGYPIDFWTQNMSGNGEPLMYYQYGAALFPLYLMERFGQSDPAYLPKLWQSFAQDGTVTITPWSVTNDQGNKPDWFEGVGAELTGHQTNLPEAHADFGAWRVAVEQRDDGHHFSRAFEYPSPTIRETIVGTSGMPAEGEIETREYGTGYVRFVPQGSTQALRATVSNPHWVRFFAELLLFRTGQPAERIPLSFEEGVATGTTGSLGDVSEVILVISQSQDLSHDPDEMEYEPVRAVSYGLEIVDVPDGGAPSDGGLPEAGDAGDAAQDAAQDATVDAPETGVDAATVDAGVTDAGPEGASAQPMLLEAAGGGCDCSSTVAKERSWPAVLLGLMLGLLWTRRRGHQS